ncbi:MAG TPA: TetR/AcrR family transcriptional regulator [Drouetiella sp.]
MSKSATRGRPKKDASSLELRNDQILAAACQMFAARGYAGTDVEELAAELGIGKGTIYRAFNSKQELFFAAVNRALELMMAFIKTEADAENAEGVARIQAGVKAFLRFFDQNPEVIELFIQERAAFANQKSSTFWDHSKRHSSRWQAFFQELMDLGYVRKLDARWLAETLNQLLYGQLFLHRMENDQASLESRSQNILTLFFTGILTSKGLEATAFGADKGDQLS